MKNLYRLITSISLLIIIILAEPLLGLLNESFFVKNNFLITLKSSLLIACSSWVLIELVRIFKTRIMRRYDISMEDNLKSRKIHTQINLLEKVIVFLIILTSIGLILISIDSINLSSK